MPLEVSPQDASFRLGGNSKAVMIDVREPEEFALARIDGAVLIPMQSISAELQKLESWSDEQDILFICHHGVRSLQVVNWLRAQGLENVYSVAGGIDRWSREVDADIPRY